MKLKTLDLWCIIAPIVMLIICIVTKTGWIEIVTSVSGVIYLSLIANQNKYGYLFSIINVIFYAILTWNNGLPGTAIFNIAYSLPVIVYGYIFWNRSQREDKDNVKYMENKSRIKLVVCVISVIFIYYIVAHYLLKIDNALVDAIVVCLSFVGNILMSRKYIEQWGIWIMLNCINLFFWATQSVNNSSSVSIVFMWILYLINNILGLIYWNKSKNLKSKK